MVTTEADAQSQAKDMYVNNMTYAQIAAALSVTQGRVRQWAFRGKWRQSRVIVPIEEKTGAPTQPIEHQAVSDRFTARILNKADQLLQSLEGMSQPKKVRDIKEAIQALAALTATTKRALETPDTGKGPRSFIAIFQGAVPPALVVQGDQRAVQASVGPVIDVSEAPSSDTQSEGEVATPNNDGHAESVQDSQSSLQSNEPLEGEQSPPEA